MSENSLRAINVSKTCRGARVAPTSVMRALALVTAAASAILATPSPAVACSLVGNNLWQQDAAQASDNTPPSKPTVEVLAVNRNQDSSGCGASSSCGSIASMHLAVSASDDRATPTQIGYEVRIVGGDAPTNFDPSRDGRISPSFGEELVFYFDFNSPSFAVDLEVRAVDANGNLGPPVVVTVEDTVDEGVGCASASRANGSLIGFGILTFATLLALRRRR